VEIEDTCCVSGRGSVLSVGVHTKRCFVLFCLVLVRLLPLLVVLLVRLLPLLVVVLVLAILLFLEILLVLLVLTCQEQRKRKKLSLKKMSRGERGRLLTAIRGAGRGGAGSGKKSCLPLPPS